MSHFEALLMFLFPFIVDVVGYKFRNYLFTVVITLIMPNVIVIK